MKQTISILLSLLILTLFIQCSDPDPVSVRSGTPVETLLVAPDIPIETLLAAPDTLYFENQSVVLTTVLWRDFQPISPPNGKPLIALVCIETPDSSDIPVPLDPNAIYVVYNNQVWKSFFSTEERPPNELKPFRITKIARDGPKWGPNVYVDVIVRILAGNEVYLLRASEQYIGRTD